MTNTRRNWTRDELVITLSLYFQLPFGRLNHATREVKELASLIGRTNSSVALRLVNFAACDPYILATGRHGMSSGVKICQPIWDEYYNNKERLFYDAEEIKANYLKCTIEDIIGLHSDAIGTYRIAEIKQRVNQNVFRTMILSNYNEKCAITGINIPELLIASHIIPWADDEKERLNPENGICLSALYDKAFDKGLITISPEDYTIVLSRELKEYSNTNYFQQHFGSIEHQHILLPEEHKPNRDFLDYHSKHIFANHN